MSSFTKWAYNTLFANKLAKCAKETHITSRQALSMKKIYLVGVIPPSTHCWFGPGLGVM